MFLHSDLALYAGRPRPGGALLFFFKGEALDFDLNKNVKQRASRVHLELELGLVLSPFDTKSSAAV